jgi:hypothetical protein
MMNSGASSASASTSGLWAARASPAPAAVVRPPGAFPFMRMHVNNVVKAPGNWIKNLVDQQRAYYYAGAPPPVGTSWGAAVGVPVVTPAVRPEQIAAVERAHADYYEEQQRRREAKEAAMRGPLFPHGARPWMGELERMRLQNAQDHADYEEHRARARAR